MICTLRAHKPIKVFLIFLLESATYKVMIDRTKLCDMVLLCHIKFKENYTSKLPILQKINLS